MPDVHPFSLAPDVPREGRRRRRRLDRAADAAEPRLPRPHVDYEPRRIDPGAGGVPITMIEEPGPRRVDPGAGGVPTTILPHRSS